ncbi:hypothetical protein BN2156_06083 [Mycolicibacterium neworleansense]|uniref:Uncharacterized protein n=1 Tax=Mycolicibacterium neworleansense TaxID=146018 RepID=A0A0H5RYX4_9MYCO|nr:hypothetical protein BN2156_06083 [Mycolicibacterium neworleansense]
MLENLVGQQCRGRDLDHHAGGQPVRTCPIGKAFRLGRGGDHGCHHQRGVSGGLSRGGDRLELVREQTGIALGDPDTAHAERRVGLLGMSGELQRFVRARIEGADHHFASGEGVEHLTVDLGLLGDRRLGVTVEEAQLGAEQPDAFGRGVARTPGGGAVLHVGQDRDRVAVGGRTRAGPLPGGQCVALGGGHRGRGLGRIRIGGQRARGPVEQDHGAGGHGIEPTDRDHTRDPELAGDDRGVAGRPAECGDEPDHQLRVQAGGIGGRQVLRAQDRRDIR